MSLVILGKNFSRSLRRHELRDRKEITCTVVEEKNGSDFEDFSEGSIIHTAEEKSSIDESIFPSRTVQVIFLRSLNMGKSRNSSVVR